MSVGAITARTRSAGQGVAATWLRRQGLLLALRAGVLLAAMAVWALAAELAGNPYLPGPVEVLAHVRELWLSGPASRLFLSTQTTQVVGATLERLIPALLIGIGGALLLGVGIALNRLLREALDPTIQFARAVPGSAQIPLFIVLLGIGAEMQIAVTAVAVAFPVLVATVAAVEAVDPTLVETARVYRTPAWRRALRVVLPAALPAVFGPIRFAVVLGLGITAFVEMVVSQDGIGLFLISAEQSYQVLDLWAAAVLLAVVGYLLNAVVVAIERVVIGWQQKARRPAD